MKECANCEKGIDKDHYSGMAGKPEEFCGKGCAKAYYPNVLRPEPVYTINGNQVVFS